MTSMLDRLLAADISDPTDFPDETLSPGLRPFDDAVRCNICRDFYDAPVSLNCGHCFCSACIRAALPEHQTCPTCRKPASEVHIRKNVAMETAVQAWKAARPLILRLSRQEEARKVASAQPPQSRHNSDHSDLARVGNKRRRLDSPATGSDDDEVILLPSSPTASGSSPPAPSDTASSLVSCPMCQRAVPYETINNHLDSDCKRYLANPEGSKSASSSEARPRNKQKQQWDKFFNAGSSATSKPRDKEKEKEKEKDKGKGKARASPEGEGEDEPEHLPKVAYDIHPQKRIAEMLAEWDLPTHGDKSALAKRHKRWIVAYNANVDRAPAQRRTLDQLRADVRKQEEAEQSSRARKETVDDPVAYQKANKAAFAKLTEAARPKKREHASLAPQSATTAAQDPPSLHEQDDDSGEAQTDGAADPKMADGAIDVDDES